MRKYHQIDLYIYQCVFQNKKQTTAVKFLELNFRNNFFVFNLSKCFGDESCRGDFPPTSPKGLMLVAQTYFCVYIVEDFAIIRIRLHFLCVLLTGKIRIGVTERGSLKNIHKRFKPGDGGGGGGGVQIPLFKGCA